MRRTSSAVLALVLAGFLALTPGLAHASAGVPLPGPVDEILDIPSRTASSVSGSPLGDSVLVDLWRAMTRSTTTSVPSPLPVPEVPKPITSPAAFTRAGAVGAGSVLTALMASWAVGSNGTLALMGVATGTDYETAFCAQPGWYQGATSFVNMGFAPDCTVEVIEPDFGGAPTFHLRGVAVSEIKATCPSIPDCGGNPYAWIVCHPASLGPGESVYVNASHNSGFMSSSSSAWMGCGAGLRRAASYPSIAAMPTVVSVVLSGPGGVIATDSTPSVPSVQRLPRCRIEWENGTTTTGTGQTYTDTAGLPMSPAGLGCEQAFVSQPGRGPSLLPDRITVESEDEAGAITEISEADVPDFAPDQRRAFETGNSRGLVLEKVVGTVATSCMTWAADCTGWWEATDEGTSTTSPYRCTYGGSPISLLECGPYRHTFDTRTGTPTITDPATGEQVEWGAQPNPDNSISPGTGPGTGSNPAGECFAAGWSAFNPIEWVLTPVKCAFVWAFVPRSSVVDAGFASMEPRWQSTAIGGLATAVAGWSFVAPSSSGCDGITVGISELGHDIEDFQILNACAGQPLEPIAALSTLVIGIGAVLTAIAAVTGSVGGIVGQRALAGGSGA